MTNFEGGGKNFKHDWPLWHRILLQPEMFIHIQCDLQVAVFSRCTQFQYCFSKRANVSHGEEQINSFFNLLHMFVLDYLIRPHIQWLECTVFLSFNTPLTISSHSSVMRHTWLALWCPIRSISWLWLTSTVSEAHGRSCATARPWRSWSSRSSLRLL